MAINIITVVFFCELVKLKNSSILWIVSMACNIRPCYHSVHSLQKLQDRLTQIKQVVKVIWHKTASSPQMDGSIVFARWRHVGTLSPPGEYDWACAFFEPPESTTQTANQSVQPFCAQLMVECRWVYRRHLANMIEIVHGGTTSRIELNLRFFRLKWSLWPKWQIDRFGHFCTTPDLSLIHISEPTRPY